MYNNLLFIQVSKYNYIMNVSIATASQTSDGNDDSSVIFIVLFVISAVINILLTIVIIYLVVRARKTSYSPNNV